MAVSRAGSNMLARAWKGLRRILAVESLDVNPAPLLLVSCTSAPDVAAWRVFSDAAFGGASNAQLQLQLDAKDGPHATFSGHVSSALPEGVELARSGYAGINTVFDSPVDLTLHDGLELLVRAHTPHTYITSLRTEQLTAANGEEAWQAALAPSKVGEWERVTLPFRAMRFTFRGRAASDAAGLTFAPMLRGSVCGMGITLAARNEGGEDSNGQERFQLDIKEVRAVAQPVTGLAAALKAELQELSPEEAAALEEEARTVAAGKALDTPGGSARGEDRA